MTDFKDAGYIILARYRNEKGELENRTAYGPYSSRDEAENDNNGLSNLSFPTPEYNEVLRLWTAQDESMNQSMLDVNNPIHTPTAEDADFLERLMELASRAKFGMKCKLKIGRDHEVPNGRFYFQIACWRMDVITKKDGWGYGGKAYLSHHMTDSELFQIMFGLYKGYWEHEARENFYVDDVRPFGPHISTEALISVARKVDIRSAKHVEDNDPPRELPHSRACGFRKHDHGADCNRNCPTCHGDADYRTDPPFDVRNDGMGSSVDDRSGAVIHGIPRIVNHVSTVNGVVINDSVNREEAMLLRNAALENQRHLRGV